MKYQAKLSPFVASSLPYLFVAVLLLSFVYPLSGGGIWDAIRSPYDNKVYSPGDFKEPLAIVAKDFEGGSAGVPKIVARKTYFAYLADAAQPPLPYTDYDGLVRYCLLNDAEYLLLEHHLLSSFPFITRFEKGETPDFQLLSKVDGITGRVELYQFKPK